MLDVEWLLSPVPFDGVVLYSYRSGVLRPSILRHLREIARQSGAELTSYDAAGIVARWSAPALFDELRICDLTGPKAQRVVEELLSLPIHAAAAPTVIMAPASSKPLRSASDLLHLEEPLITRGNIARVLRYLVSTSDLTSPDLTSEQEFLRKHFSRRIEEQGSLLLSDVMQDFDHAVVHHSSLGAGELAPISGDLELTGRSYLVESLQRFLASDEAFALSELLRALAIRQERGWSPTDLIEDLLKASVRVREISVASAHGRLGKRKSAYRSEIVAKEVTLLWIVLILVWSRACTSNRTDPAQIAVLVDFDHLCRDFKRRLHDLAGDPLKGCWTRVRDAFLEVSAIDENERSDTRAELLRSVSRNDCARQGYPWVEKLHRTAAQAQRHRDVHVTRSSVLETPNEDVDFASFADVMGQKHIVQELRGRFQSGRHDRPLLLTGPDGCGKRAISRLYAKALLCEGGRLEMQPCGSCPSCTSFKGGASFGYCELDVSHDEGLSHVHQMIRTLQYVPLTDRRVVLIKNADRSSEAINAALKTLELGAVATSVILLAQDERSVEAAARSRSAVYRVRPLSEDDARVLVRRWLPSNQIEGAVIELIVTCGRGLPGSISKLCQRIAMASASTLKQAKDLLGFSWGAQILEYWQALLDDRFQSAAALDYLSDMTSEEAICRLRAALHELSGKAAISEPAFLGLESDLHRLANCFERIAATLGLMRVALWKELAQYWFDDSVIDREDVIDVSVRTCRFLNVQTGGL